MTTRYDDYVEVDAYAEDDTEVSDFTAAWAAGLFWLGVLLVATPLAPMAIAMCPIGGVIWLCRPALRQAEADMSQVARDTGASTQSGCALLWLWLVGLTVFALALLAVLAALGAVMSAGGI